MKRILIITLAAAVMLTACAAGKSQEGAESRTETAEASPQTESAQTEQQTQQPETESEIPEINPADPVAELVLEINGTRYYPDLADNSSAEAFFEKLKDGPLELDLHDYGNFEKVGPLPWELPRNDEQITTSPGDIILYQGNQITIYYDENSWSFTRLGRIDGVTKEDLLTVMGDGDVKATFWLEWSE